MTDKLQENAQPLFDMLCRAFDALDNEEESVKEEHADLISDMGALIDSVRPEVKPHVYTFHLKVLTSVNIEANSEEEAVAMLENQHFECVNLGAFDNGEPILATVDDIEDSSGGPLGAVKVDGEEI